MTPYFTLSVGLSISVIGLLTIVGWAIDSPTLTTWRLGSIPMAPVTAVLTALMGASLVLCSLPKRLERCIPGFLIGAFTLAVSVTLLILRVAGRYPAIEHLGFGISGIANGSPTGFISPIAAACFAVAAIAFIAQAAPRADRHVRLVSALSAALVLMATGFATLLTMWLGYPLLAGTAQIPLAANTSVVLLLLGSGLAASGIRHSDRSARRAQSHDRSWRPLALAFVAVVFLTSGFSYAVYRQEEQDIRRVEETRLDRIRIVSTNEATDTAAVRRSAGALVRTQPIPNTDLSLMSVTTAQELESALWGRLGWVLTFAAMLLVSAGAILALFWRTHRAAQDRERTAHAERLRIEATRVSDLAARSPAVLYTLRPHGTQYVPTDMTANVERILGYTLEEALEPAWFAAHVFPEDRAAAMASPDALSTADELINEFRFVRKDGSVLWVLNQMTVTRREHGRPVEITGAWHDITARREAEAALRQSEERLRLALAAAGQGLWDLNVQTGEAIVSPEYEAMVGDEPGSLHETHSKWISRLHPDDRDLATARYRDYVEGRAESYIVEFRQQNGSGEWRWILSRGSLIARSPDGRPLRMLGIHTDITARKLAELRADALLKEVHHRVKNNLQVISSLLRLERDRHDDAIVKSAMGDMQLRILSMALLHETLYKSSDLARVDLGAYLADLARQVFRATAPSNGAVSLRLDLDSALVDIDQAIPSGLIVNEVLSNCLKHAFPDGRTGTVTITLKPGANPSAITLRISDTGVGLPHNFETRRASSLGIVLIKTLARQLNAELTVDAGPGASFGIAFATTVSAPPEVNV